MRPNIVTKAHSKRVVIMLFLMLIGFIGFSQNDFSHEDFEGVYSSEMGKNANPGTFFEIYIKSIKSEFSVSKREVGSTGPVNQGRVSRRAVPPAAAKAKKETEYEQVTLGKYRILIKTVLYADKELKAVKSERFYTGIINTNHSLYTHETMRGKIIIDELREFLGDMRFAYVSGVPAEKATLSIDQGVFEGLFMPGIGRDTKGTYTKSAKVSVSKWNNFATEAEQKGYDIRVGRHMVNHEGREMLYLGKERIIGPEKWKDIRFYIDKAELDNLAGKPTLRVLMAEDEADWKLEPSYYRNSFTNIAQLQGADPDNRSSRNPIPILLNILHELLQMTPSVNEVSVYFVPDWNASDLYAERNYLGKNVIVKRLADNRIPAMNGFKTELKSLWD